MRFYTSVARYGSSILYRGYDGPQRVKKKEKFKPTLYVPSKDSKSEWKALDSTPVEPMKFDSMRDAKEFSEKYADVQNFKIYGNTNYVAQYIAEKFPGEINFDRSKIRVATIDIEVRSDAGFPEPNLAKHEVVSIAMKDSVLDCYYVWGLKDYDVSRAETRDGCQVHYIKCVSEASLLKLFIDHWSAEHLCPDVVTGWNIRTFDIPYLVNRITRVLGEDQAKRLSPWGMVEEKMVPMMKKTVQVYNLVGVAQMDFMDLFMKFGYSFGPQESYRLDHIANVVLGERKLSYEEHGNLTNLYEADHQKFIDYNIRDVYLVYRMEDKIGLITLAMTVAYKASTNYADTMGTTAIWDCLIHKYLLSQKIIIPANTRHIKTPYEGAYVKDVQVGMHDWVCSFDVASLYPNIIVQWNMSPETTLIGQVEPGVSVDACLNGYKTKSEHSVAASGQCFSKAKQGFMPKLIEDLYEERVSIKKKMIAAKQQLELVKAELIRRENSK